MTLTHLSPSSWNTFDQCQRRWGRRYIDGITDPVGWEAEVGTFGHIVLDQLYQLPGFDRTEDAAREMAGRLWAINPLPLSIIKGDITERLFIKKAWRSVSGDFEIEDPPSVEVHATEKAITWTESGIPFKVIVDRIDKKTIFDLPGLGVIDYKTGKVPDNKKDRGVRRRWPHERQVVIGAMGVAATIKAPADRGALLYVGQSETLPVDTSLKARSAVLHDAAGVWGEMKAAVATADTWTDLEPTVGVLCNWCPAVIDCDAGRAYIRRAESGGWKSHYPDAPGAKAVAELDGTRPESF